MSQSILTNALSAYKAEQEAEGLPVILDEFIFALIPGLDPETPIDPNETIPPEAQIQGRFPVSAKGVINPDAVVYSIILGTDIGTWNFNAIYLVNKDLNLAGAIIHTIEQTKEKADPTSGIEGDTLTRNIVTPYTNAAELTQIVVSADTWQLDFNNRLSAMDERVRKNNVTEYGNAAFFDDAWKVNHTAGETSLTIDPGLGYVGGLQSVNDSLATLDLTGITLPKTVYLVSSFQGAASSAWGTINSIKIEDTLADTWIENGITYYSAPLASLSSTENAKDLRKPNTDTEFVRKDNAATDEDIDNESQAEKHVNLPQFWRGLSKFERKDNAATDEEIDHVSLDNKYILLPQLWRAFDTVRPLKTYTDINQLNLTDDDFAPPATLKVLSNAMPPGSVAYIDLSDGGLYRNLRSLTPAKNEASVLTASRGLYQKDQNRCLFKWNAFGSNEEYMCTSDYISGINEVTEWSKVSFREEIVLAENNDGWGNGASFDWSQLSFKTSDFTSLLFDIEFITNNVDYPDGSLRVEVNAEDALSLTKCHIGSITAPGTAQASVFIGAVNISESGLTISIMSQSSWSGVLKRIVGIKR